MLVGQQFGPFLIDKELGAGAMGAVYRGKYLKTGQVVAIKVMSPGLGISNPDSLARFEREANVLKQLRHPNIVRLFGVGRHQGTPYYAMEYIQGESLDRVMARRNRMSWEEVVDLGMQLCSALQHAHQAGIIHRDLKPSNLMILSDGTLKLTDFGIAKDLDQTQLTATNRTVGTAAYMSPEQCQGSQSITYKSDLYSLGVVLFELITGRKPFLADNPMDMFLMHVKTVPERPSRFALDIPIWLDTLIMQLLEKKPEHRPLDAAMVANVLASIREKVEAQHSAGIDAVKTRRGERTAGTTHDPTDEDRLAARTLLGKKARKKKKLAFHEHLWVRALGLILLLAFVVSAIIILAQPPSAERLFAQAEKLMLSDKSENHDKARDGPIRQYLARYGHLDNPRTEQIRKWAEDYDAAFYEKLLDRHLRHVKEKKGLAVEAQTPSQERSFQAAVAEFDGDREQAVRLWKEVLDAEGSTGIGAVAKKHLAALANLDEEFKRLDQLQLEVRNFKKEPSDLPELLARAFTAYRQEKLGDRAGAKKSYERLREAASKEPVQRFYQMLAAVKIRQLKESLAEKPQDDKARVDLLNRLLDAAERSDKWLDSRLLAHEIALLYSQDEELASLVQRAQQIVQIIDKKLGRNG